MQERKNMNIEGRETHLARLRKQLKDLRKNEDNYAPDIFKQLEKKYVKRIVRVSKGSY